MERLVRRRRREQRERHSFGHLRLPPRLRVLQLRRCDPVRRLLVRAGWAIVNRVVPANGYTASSPAATVYSVNRDRIAVFHRGVDNHVYRQDHNPTTGAWDYRWPTWEATSTPGPSPVRPGTFSTRSPSRSGVRTTAVVHDLRSDRQDLRGWRSITAFEGSTVCAPSLVSNIAAAITYVLITHRYWTGQLWEKRIV